MYNDCRSESVSEHPACSCTLNNEVMQTLYIWLGIATPLTTEFYLALKLNFEGNTDVDCDLEVVGGGLPVVIVKF